MGPHRLAEKAASNLFRAVLPLALWSIGCGGGSGGMVEPPPLPPDFSISTPPGTMIVGVGESGTLTVSVTALNGFSQQVSVSIQNLPTGVTANPATFDITPGSQQVKLTAAATAPTGAFTFNVVGMVSNINHSTPVALAVETPVTGANGPVRARYLRTNSFYDSNSLQFAPPHFTVYDSAHRQFLSAILT